MHGPLPAFASPNLGHGFTCIGQRQRHRHSLTPDYFVQASELFQFQEIDEDSIDRLYDAIDKIAADGRTDLSGGLEMGLDQIGASEDTSTACRTQEVFVFSDGEPNQGQPFCTLAYVCASSDQMVLKMLIGVNE